MFDLQTIREMNAGGPQPTVEEVVTVEPGTSDGENADRVELVTRVLEFVGMITDDDDDDMDNIVDLLTNLRHWCDANSIDFAASDRIAGGHYEEEKSQ